MGLDDPTKKMSKSATSAYNYIALQDGADTIRKKFSKAVTDSGSEVKFGEDKPGWNNLLTIYQLVTNRTQEVVAEEVKDMKYSEAKTVIGEAVIDHLKNLQAKYHEIMDEPGRIDEILERGAQKARALANETLMEAKKAVGLV